MNIRQFRYVKFTKAKTNPKLRKIAVTNNSDITYMISIFKVTPTPGMCIKTKNVKDEKVFINLCKIQEIPPAPPLSEEKLKDIIASEDYSSDFRYYIFSQINAN